MSVPPPPGQFGPPPQQPPGGPNPWGAQQPWQPGPPPKRGAGKWIFGAIALIAVIAVTVAITVLVTRDGGGGSGGDPSTPASDIASANDKGPVTIITEEPTCDQWLPISKTLSDRTNNGWERRDASQPASSWSFEQRSIFDAVAVALEKSAQQATPLAKQTPHRVMREIYGQFSAYAREYAKIIPTYTSSNESLARVWLNLSVTVDSICAAISQGSATAISTDVPASSAPTHLPELGEVDQPTLFLERTDIVCPDVKTLTADFDVNTAPWQGIDSQIPATQWTPAQKAINDAVLPIFNSYADGFTRVAGETHNGVLQDFANLASTYSRAYASALPTYTSADGYLSNASVGMTASIKHACAAAES